ncbi:MAG: DUF2169 domain-containing protein [Polyangiaceae bacterium]
MEHGHDHFFGFEHRAADARSTEDIGACLGAIVLACVDDARKHAFCLSTDATGVSIRPKPLPDGTRQPCRKGHFFVVLADKKHVFFELQPKHTSAAVCEAEPDPLSLLRFESDLVAFKPRADIVLVGSAYAPRGQPTKSFDVGA